MEKRQSLVLGLLVLGALVFASTVFVRLSQGEGTIEVYREVSPSAELVVDFSQAKNFLFTNMTCPQCVRVEDYLKQSGRNALVVAVVLDANLGAPDYQERLSEVTSECGLERSQVGIPLLYLNGGQQENEAKCIVGDEAIIDYLENLAQ